MNSLYENVCNGWTFWNRQLERGTTCVAQHLSRTLPHSVLPLVQTNRLTQMQLLVHSLGLAVLSAVSVGNPAISAPVAFSVLGAGVMVTIKPLLRYLHSYSKEVAHLPSHQRVRAITIPLLIGVIEVGSALCMKERLFFHGFRTGCSSLLYMGSVGLAVNSVVNTICCSSDDVIEAERSQEGKERLQEEHELVRLREDVVLLRNMKKRLEAFVVIHPQLQEECSRALEKDPGGIGELSPVSLEGVDERARLMVEKIGLEHDLDVRMRFILLHRQLRESFEEHVRQEGMQGLEWGNYGN